MAEEARCGKLNKESAAETRREGDRAQGEDDALQNLRLNKPRPTAG